MDIPFFDILDLNAPVTAMVMVQTCVVLFLGLVFSYFALTVPLYFYFNVKGGNGAVKLQDKPVSSKQIKDEIKWSIMSMVQYAVVTALLLFAWRLGYFQNLYIAPWEMGWLYFFISIPMLVLIQDAMFYWTHRLLHTRKFAKYHARHHRSKTPTVFAVYSFHPVEAFLHAIRLPVILLIMPVNLFALIFSENMISNLINAYGHLNYEPKLVRKMAFLHRNSAANASYHNLHHEKSRGNYGFYLKFWDRMFGTLHVDTDMYVERVHRDLTR